MGRVTTTVGLALATGLGVGYVPFAPGTFGSAVGLLLWIALPTAPMVQAAVIAAVFAVGVWSAGVTERHYRSTDPGVVVIDEVLGMLITLAIQPVGWAGAALAFLLFRAFDVLKPYPANRVERMHGGFGIMADDGVAGLYANIVLRLALLWAPAGLL
ncbi:MAG: phosphatidylglycerophosphatase A [Acidimicrobiia bacterium]|nr:phosphatidylglycerophosphatase A [Acidimicrobiia bacterium]